MAPPDDKEGQGDLPSIDFTTLLLSFASSAQIQLGLVADPMTQKVSQNLSMAKQTIDLISVLGEKTKGNLSAEEGELMETLLYNLRLQFIEMSKRDKIPPNNR